jgi:predicted transposase/invertase (TIGR01784 family)
MTPAESWAVFLRYHTTKNKRALVNRILEAKEDIAMAGENILEFTEKEREWFRNESKLKYELDMQGILYRAKRAAEAEGLAKGQKKAEKKAGQEKRKSARMMKAEGLSHEQISRFTGLSSDEIARL